MCWTGWHGCVQLLSCWRSLDKYDEIGSFKELQKFLEQLRRQTTERVPAQASFSERNLNIVQGVLL